MKQRLSQFFLLGIIALLAGCNPVSVKWGWIESSSLAHKKASYANFNGVEKAIFHARAGQTVNLKYDLTVKQGSLALTLQDFNGAPLWDERFDQDAADTLKLTADEGGLYTLRVVGENTEGGFDISWETED
jgi:hypothetical protein